jgi:small subunit ribosomal protein S19
MAEKVAFRGKMPSELEKLSNDDYLKIVKSRQRRSIRRNGITYKKLLEKVQKHKATNSQKPIRTHVREAVILPGWIGLRFEVYNGKEFHPVQISASMLGHRLGEFAFSTKSVVHSAPGIRATRGSKFLGEK